MYSQAVLFCTTIPGLALLGIHLWCGFFWIKDGAKLTLNRIARTTDYVGYAPMEMLLR